jgi:pyrroline-5-carboxylate reductase
MGFELVIVGGGNMGAALLGGLLASGRYDPVSIAVVEIVPERRRELEANHPGVATAETVPESAAAVIAVKPPDAPTAAAAAAAAGATRLLSIAAGVKVAALQAATGPDVAVIRAMPNTPALVGQAASVITESAAEEDLAWAEQVLGAVGTVHRLPEHHLDAITALTGSGPAYLFLIAEALIDAGVEVGLPRPLVTALTTQLFVGSSALLAERGDAAALRRMVTSPGGTTAAGLAVLDDREVPAAFTAAVRAAAARSAELG